MATLTFEQMLGRVGTVGESAAACICNIGIETAQQLAQQDPKKLAARAGIGEQIATEAVEWAKSLKAAGPGIQAGGDVNIDGDWVGRDKITK